jgi:AcrR family transcriptional regulator
LCGSSSTKRTDALSRERIVAAAIEILDADGESALTFRELAARLATGSGAICWHVASKNELLTAATDDVISRVVTEVVSGAEPQEAIRAIALGVFDAIDAHPWVGTQLSGEPWQSAMLQILEGIGGQLQALGVPERAQFDSASALVTTSSASRDSTPRPPAFSRARRIDRPSSRPSPHGGRNSTPRSTRSCIRWQRNCPSTTTANGSSPASTSSWPASQQSDRRNGYKNGPAQTACLHKGIPRLVHLSDSRHGRCACPGRPVAQRPAISPVRCSRSARRWTAAQVR